MSSNPKYEEVYPVEGDDFALAGLVSLKIKRVLAGLGFDPETIRRVAIITYEAEMNIILYADRGEMRLKVWDDVVELEIEDVGPGIEDIEMAMKDGYSTATDQIRELGFGAGMGLPNIKRNSNDLVITSTVGQGTKLVVTITPKHGKPS